MNIESQLSEFITQNLLANRQYTQLGLDENLLLNGMIDSLGVMQVVKFVEDNFDIEVAPAEVTLKNFMTISAMTQYITKKAAVAN